jgi:hypothetical protein
MRIFDKFSIKSKWQTVHSVNYQIIENKQTNNNFVFKSNQTLMNWPQIAFNLLYIPVIVFILLSLIGLISIVIEIVIPIFKSKHDHIIPLLIIMASISYTFLTFLNKSETHLSKLDYTYLSVILGLLVLEIWFNELYSW